MILCTSCGTKNADDAHTCEKCGRKLQSRWSRPGGLDAQNGNGANGASGDSGGSILPEEVWEFVEPVVLSVEEGADTLVKACAETWAYALILIVGAGVYIGSEDWRYLAGSVALAAVLAWARGI
ncbi:MAG: zinc ribbon domain-containing protein [Proteobacteria bacterium]|nr:zinc ribbon domain-containing protein [Pseudomonadota bacterium]